MHDSCNSKPKFYASDVFNSEILEFGFELRDRVFQDFRFPQILPKTKSRLFKQAAF